MKSLEELIKVNLINLINQIREGSKMLQYISNYNRSNQSLDNQTPNNPKKEKGRGKLVLTSVPFNYY